MNETRARSVRCSRILGSAAGVGLVLLLGAGCAGSNASTNQAATTLPPTTSGGTRVGTTPGTQVNRSLLGTWVGDYSYPLAAADGTPQKIDATETLVIEKQEGDLVWGVDQYVEEGNTIKIPVRGTLDATGSGFTLTEEGGFFRGELQADGTMHVRFTRTDGEFTSFEATLRRQ